MIPREEAAAILDDFAKKVIQQARRNLTIFSGNKTLSLHKSFERDIEVFQEGIDVVITANDYWKFKNYGVKGIVSGNSLKGFRFKSKGGLKGMPPPSAFKTDKINRLVSDQQAFASAVNVFKFGIKPTEFFTRPFKEAFDKLAKELEEAYAIDVEEYLHTTLDDGNR
jgi:hypothetical protein